MFFLVVINIVCLIKVSANFPSGRQADYSDTDIPLAPAGTRPPQAACHHCLLALIVFL